MQVATLGTAGGLLSALLTWIADRMDTLDHGLALLTHIVGLGIALLTFLLLLRRWRRSDRLPPREPPDVDDDLPFR